MAKNIWCFFFSFFFSQFYETSTVFQPVSLCKKCSSSLEMWETSLRFWIGCEWMGKKANKWYSVLHSLNNCRWEALDPQRLQWSCSAARSQTLWLCWAAPRCECVKLYECEAGSSWKRAIMFCSVHFPWINRDELRDHVHYGSWILA